MGLTYALNVLTGQFDLVSDEISPSTVGFLGAYDASGGAFPATPANPGYFIISVAGTLPAPVGDVLPGDYLTYDGSSWGLVDNPNQILPQTGASTPVGNATPRYIGDSYIDTSGPTKYWAFGLTNADWMS